MPIFISDELCNTITIQAANSRSAKNHSGRIIVILLCLVITAISASIFLQSNADYNSFLFLSISLFAFFRYGAIFYSPTKNETFNRQKRQIAPTYSVLIALYDEASVVEQLTKSLANLDWPADKLDIIFLCERDDIATPAAIMKFANPQNSRLLILPDGLPRTKPRALNIGLKYAKGHFLCVYDAEDRPEPSQLKHAFHQFTASDETLGVIQAKLVTENHKESLISSFFALDYAVWFRVLLPFIARTTGFIPLGGTSNHFRTATLRKIGGWDPYNLTEDADLGIKLGLAGFTAQIINSVTYEEAPPTYMGWLKQRTRWLQGHIQTLAVHFAELGNLLRPHNLQQFLGIFVAIALGPFFIAMRVLGIISTIYFINQAHIMGISAVAFTLILEIGLNLVAIKRDGRAPLAVLIPILPLYFTLQFVAVFRACIRIFTKPYIWEKTAHGIKARIAKSNSTFTIGKLLRIHAQS